MSRVPWQPWQPRSLSNDGSPDPLVIHGRDGSSHLNLGLHQDIQPSKFRKPSLLQFYHMHTGHNDIKATWILRELNRMLIVTPFIQNLAHVLLLVSAWAKRRTLINWTLNYFPVSGTTRTHYPAVCPRTAYESHQEYGIFLSVLCYWIWRSKFFREDLGEPLGMMQAPLSLQSHVKACSVRYRL